MESITLIKAEKGEVKGGHLSATGLLTSTENRTHLKVYQGAATGDQLSLILVAAFRLDL